MKDVTDPNGMRQKEGEVGRGHDAKLSVMNLRARGTLRARPAYDRGELTLNRSSRLMLAQERRIGA